MLQELDYRLKVIEERFAELGYDMKKIAQSEYKNKWSITDQPVANFGLFTAICVDTIDPLKQNRVRFFSPAFHENDLQIEQLPWASPISACGGFDDCGLSWVPPVGSTLCILFENGARSSPYYLGTTWHRNRMNPLNEDKKVSIYNWNYAIKEFDDIHKTHRKGYLVGKNDESQVLPQWNTENYNGFDYDSIVDFEKDIKEKKKITYANIYGFKTPQKHSLKFVDGDYKCNHKAKRLELLSSCGNWMIFKDDWLHNSGTWAHPQCGVSGAELNCLDENGKPTEITSCDGQTSNSTILGGHPSTPDGTKYGLNSNKGSNQYFKHANECRPYKGPGTPKNNKCCLPQSGIQFLSRSGHTMFFDDSVEEPTGIPEWEESTKPFDFGCNDKFLGKMKIVSATGHEIELSDIEEPSRVRNNQNLIRIKSATGNLIELNDHTNPKCNAGDKRGIAIISSSNHHLMMIDEENEQCSPVRKDTGDVNWTNSGGQNTAKAKKAFIRMRSGYGLELLMKDADSQEKTEKQFIRLFAPQKDNTDRGAHMLLMQEKPSGPGLTFLKVGGNYVCVTYDNHIDIVGEKDKNPSNKIVYVSKNYVEISEEYYENFAKLHLFLADEYILLLAGQDCPSGGQSSGGPCIAPVVCMNTKGQLVISDKVYASAGPDAQQINIFQLLPFAQSNN
jgi:hypothetical protein